MKRAILLLPCLALAGHAQSIRFLDLATDSARQTIVDRDPAQYLGHPTTVVLDDGKTLLAVYPKGHGKGAIVYKRSSDGGKTWSPRLPVPENWATSGETPTLFRVTDPATRRKRLLLFSGLEPVRLASSDDDGKTWTPLAPIGDFGGIVPMASLLQRANGDLVAWFHSDGRFANPPQPQGRFVVYDTVSRDGGRTWSAPRAVVQHPEALLCEPGLVRSPDGRRWAMLLRENSRKFHSFVVFSEDEGLTWSEPKQLPWTLTGDRHVASYAKDGRLLLTFRDTAKESVTRGDWVLWVGRWEDLEQGTPGQYRVRLMNNHKAQDCCYPGFERLGDGSFVTVTYGHWTEGQPPYIVGVKFRLEELDRLTGAGSGSPPSARLASASAM